MKKISRWASMHPRYAQITIVASFLMLNVLGYYCGLTLHELGLNIPVQFFAALITVYLIAFFIYPDVTHKRYLRQKTTDLILAASGFLMMISIANNPDLVSAFSPDANAVTSHGRVVPHDSLAHRYKPISAFSASLKDANGQQVSKKERRKLLKEQIRAIRHSDELSNGNKVLLIILSVVVAIGLLTLVASASCSLSCSGSDGAAFLVGIGGTALVVFLLLIALKAINRKKRKAAASPPPVQPRNGTI